MCICCFSRCTHQRVCQHVLRKQVEGTGKYEIPPYWLRVKSGVNIEYPDQPKQKANHRWMLLWWFTARNGQCEMCVLWDCTSIKYGFKHSKFHDCWSDHILISVFLRALAASSDVGVLLGSVTDLPQSTIKPDNKPLPVDSTDAHKKVTVETSFCKTAPGI